MSSESLLDRQLHFAQYKRAAPPHKTLSISGGGADGGRSPPTRPNQLHERIYPRAPCVGVQEADQSADEVPAT